MVRPRALAAVLFTTVVGLGILAAACGSGPPAAGSKGRSETSSQIAYARCMRSKGVPNFPDPTSNGEFSKSVLARLANHNSHFQDATRACVHLLPHGGSQGSQNLQQVRTEGVEFARCMRRHGVHLPDPASTGRIPDPATLGINQGSPGFEAANQACGRYRPPYMPSNAQYNAYAQTHGS
jgi:hypothetical protein